MLIHKAQPGSDSFGHTWTVEDPVVDVPDEQAAELLAIADAGFTVVERHQDDPGGDDGQGDQGDQGGDPEGGAGHGGGPADPPEVTEVEPAGPPADAGSQPPRKRAARRAPDPK